MKIKHYPGKAVMNDPAWLEMDIPNSMRGRQYEANWEDAQKSLSNNSSTSNSWDKYSHKSMDGTISSRLGQYQTMLDEIKKDNEDIYAVPNKPKTGKDSIRLKYHSDKCLSRINSKNKKDVEKEMAKYFLPSQAKVQREHSLRLEEKEAPKPKPRKKLPGNVDQDKEKFKVVIDDLQKHMKKSVRFDEVTSEITSAMDDYKEDNVGEVKAISEIDEKTLQDGNGSDPEEIQERVSTWIDDQNRYLITVDDDDDKKQPQTALKRSDSGYYEHSEKPRQRLPPRNIYPSSSSSTSEESLEERAFEKSSSSEGDLNEMYSLYKKGSRRAVVDSQPKSRTSPTTRRAADPSDFLIPRPKLIVPVHTYAVRKRRTGNILSECYDSDCNSVRDSKVSRSSKGLCLYVFLRRF